MSDALAPFSLFTYARISKFGYLGCGHFFLGRLDVACHGVVKVIWTVFKNP